MGLWSVTQGLGCPHKAVWKQRVWLGSSEAFCGYLQKRKTPLLGHEDTGLPQAELRDATLTVFQGLN